MQPQLALSFDDVLLVPKYSEVLSREDVDINSFLTKGENAIQLDVPVIATPMETITEYEMAQAMANIGGIGIIHRFMSIKKQAEQISRVNGLVGFAVGVNDGWQERTEKGLEAGADVVMVDIAHGNCLKQVNMIKEFKQRWPDVPLIGANVADYDGTKRLCDLGVNSIRCNIGGGSLCTTRIMTGFGVPSISSLQWAHQAIEEGKYEVSLLQDGGIRHPADLAKAIAAGADAAICGGLFAGCTETPGNPQYNTYTRQFTKSYKGSASAGAKRSDRYVEGAEKIVEVKGPVDIVVRHLMEGLQSSLSYNGSFNIKHFQATAEFIRMTQFGLKESQPHFLG